MPKRLRLALKLYSDPRHLTAADLISNEDYERGRSEFLHLATRHRSQRRLRLDNNLSLVFETRFTAWLQVQEELRWLTHPTESDIDEVLNRCNLLITNPSELAATVFVDGGNNPTSRYWIECIAGNTFSLALRLCGTVMLGCPHESSAGVLATVHSFVFRPTAHCGPTSEIIWGDNTAKRSEPLPAVTRHALERDLNPSSNLNCFVSPAHRGAASDALVTEVGSHGFELARYPKLRSVVKCESEGGVGSG